jgi:hypothetical protein
MSNPDKRTITGAIIYGLCAPILNEKKRPQAWSALSAEERKPYIEVAEFLGGQMFGVDPQMSDRPRLAATLEKAGFAVLKDVNANTVVSVVINVNAALP